MSKNTEYFINQMAVETDECMLWPFCIDAKGYGQIYLNRKTQKVHNAALKFKVGEGKLDKTLCLHKPIVCHNRACFNYRHLYWGSYTDNKKDQLLDGTSVEGVRHGMTKLTEKEVLSIYNDSRGNTELSRVYNIDRAMIRRIKTKQSWKSVLCK